MQTQGKKAARKRNNQKKKPQEKSRVSPAAPAAGAASRMEPVQSKKEARLRSDRGAARNVDHFLKQVMLPDMADTRFAAIPMAVSTSPQIAMYKLTTSIDLDFNATLKAIQSTVPTKRPIVLRGFVETPVWAIHTDTTSVPIFQTHDPAFPLCMPLKSTPPVTITTPRRFAYTVDDIEIGPLQYSPNEAGMMTSATQLLITSYGVVGALSFSAFPPGFAERPVFANRYIADTSNYIWVDAGSVDNGAATTLGLYITTTTLSFQTVVAGVQKFDVEFVAERLSSDGTFTSLSGHTSTSFTITALNVTLPAINTTLSLSNSGFYRFTAIARLYTQGGTPVAMRSTVLSGMSISQLEYCELGTAFFKNTQFTSASGSLGFKHYPMGVGLLASFRANYVNNAGSILAVNTSDVNCPMFYEATSLGSADISSRVATSKQYRAGSGGRIQDGLWAFVSPCTWFDRMLPIADSRLASETAPVLAYWPATANAPSGTNLIFISPNASSSVDVESQLIMRLTVNTTGFYNIKTQFITPSVRLMLTPDQFATALALLAEVPNFSENDWHSFFNKIASVAGSVAGGIMRGVILAQQIFPKVEIAASNASGLATAVGGIASVLATL